MCVMKNDCSTVKNLEYENFGMDVDGRRLLKRRDFKNEFLKSLLFKSSGE